MTLEYLISHYGHVALVIGTFLEGESILIVAGFAVHLGYLKSQWVILAAFAGSMSGDQLYFFLGRVKGEAFLQKRPRWETKVRRVWKLLDRYRTLLAAALAWIIYILAQEEEGPGRTSALKRGSP